MFIIGFSYVIFHRVLKMERKMFCYCMMGWLLCYWTHITCAKISSEPRAKENNQLKAKCLPVAHKIDPLTGHNAQISAHAFPVKGISFSGEEGCYWWIVFDKGVAGLD